MSRKKPVILGPDGKPYVAPRPKRDAVVTVTNAEGGQTVISDEVHSFTFDAGAGVDYTAFMARWLQPNPYRSIDGRIAARKAASKPKPLAEVIAEQVGSLAADFDGVGGAELPRPEPDLHTYADAYTSAVKNCRHPNPESTLYARGEFYCPDCQRYFGPEEYKRTRERGLFGGWFS